MKIFDWLFRKEIRPTISAMALAAGGCAGMIPCDVTQEYKDKIKRHENTSISYSVLEFLRRWEEKHLPSPFIYCYHDMITIVLPDCETELMWISDQWTGYLPDSRGWHFMWNKNHHGECCIFSTEPQFCEKIDQFYHEIIDPVYEELVRNVSNAAISKASHIGATKSSLSLADGRFK